MTTHGVKVFGVGFLQALEGFADNPIPFILRELVALEELRRFPGRPVVERSFPHENPKVATLSPRTLRCRLRHALRGIRGRVFCASP
jgi:hypothetical protein